jgi:methylphosphotriester-DNA--protein-cysteine methyltransferase
VFHHAVALVEAAYAGASDMALAAGLDLLTACLDESGNARRPPPWLKHLKEEIEFAGLTGVDVAARARAGGVHPTHASRLFRQCFGVSMTEHARAHSIRRVLPLIARPEMSLSQAALEAGFYDQSHMNRVFNRVLGKTPSAMRGLLTRAAC